MKYGKLVLAYTGKSAELFLCCKFSVFETNAIIERPSASSRSSMEGETIRVCCEMSRFLGDTAINFIEAPTALVAISTTCVANLKAHFSVNCNFCGTTKKSPFERSPTTTSTSVS